MVRGCAAHLSLEQCLKWLTNLSDLPLLFCHLWLWSFGRSLGTWCGAVFDSSTLSGVRVCQYAKYARWTMVLLSFATVVFPPFGQYTSGAVFRGTWALNQTNCAPACLRGQPQFFFVLRAVVDYDLPPSSVHWWYLHLSRTCCASTSLPG